jgi:hypothetical protein
MKNNPDPALLGSSIQINQKKDTKISWDYPFNAWLGGCSGSVGDVVAQLAKATGWHQTANAVVPGSNPASLTVSWTGPGNITGYQKQVSGWEASLPEQKKKNG